MMLCLFPGFLLQIFVGLGSILWGHCYPLFLTWDDSAVHEFHRKGGLIVGCALLSLAFNDQCLVSVTKVHFVGPLVPHDSAHEFYS